MKIWVKNEREIEKRVKKQKLISLDPKSVITIGYKKEKAEYNIFTLETKHPWFTRKIRIKYPFIFTVAPWVLFILAGLAWFSWQVLLASSFYFFMSILSLKLYHKVWLSLEPIKTSLIKTFCVKNPMGQKYTKKKE